MPPASDVIGSWHPHSCVSHWLKSHLEVNLVFLPKFLQQTPADCSEACQKPGGHSRCVSGLLPARNPSVAPFSQTEARSALPLLTSPLNSIRTVNWMTSVASACALWSSIKRGPAWPPKYSKNYSAFGIKPCSHLTFDIVNSCFLFVSLRCHGV